MDFDFYNEEYAVGQFYTGDDCYATVYMLDNDKDKQIFRSECIKGLNIKESGIYIDGTMGGAGHSKYIVNNLSKKGKLIGIDRDETALSVAQDRLKEFSNVIYVHDNHDNIDNILEELAIEGVDGILLDLGVSSPQIDNIERGFYGQEIDLTTYNLCRINMFLHDVGFDKFDVACEDTLINPQHWDDEPFELIVSNPPYIPSEVIEELMEEVKEYEYKSTNQRYRFNSR